MKKIIILALIALALSARPAGEPPVIECTTDTDCELKNPWVCGGPYERPCDNKE